MMLHLDGSTLEGGGQLVRIAVALSALTGSPLKISRIRGNREDSKGLKASHCAAIKFLLLVCGGTAKGNQVGCHDLVFYPMGEVREAGSNEQDITGSLRQLNLCSIRGPRGITVEPAYDIRLPTPGSVFLVFQALYPYLLFAGAYTRVQDGDSFSNTDGCPREIQLTISGGTNVSFSPSYDYMSQVLIPTFAKLGLPPLSIKLKKRGWVSGQRTELGAVSFAISPLSVNGTSSSDTTLSPSHGGGRIQAETPLVTFPSIDLEAFDKGIITQIDVTILAPDTLAQKLLAERSSKSARNRRRDTKLRGKPASSHSDWCLNGFQEELEENGEEEEEGAEQEKGEEGEGLAGDMISAGYMEPGPHQTTREFLRHQTINMLSKKLSRRTDEQCRPTAQEISALEEDRTTQGVVGDVVLKLRTSEATSHYSQTYILLVAHTSTGFRLGRDVNYSSFHRQSSGKRVRHGNSRKAARLREETGNNILARMKDMVEQCVTDLIDEFEDDAGGQRLANRRISPKKAVDVHMRDQIVIFESLGRLASRPARPLPPTDRAQAIIEEGLSLHARTAMWVCEQMLG